MMRPTNGNTVAIGRFKAEGPDGYVAVYQDGTHGPMRETRAQAEEDYTMSSEASYLEQRDSHMSTARAMKQTMYDSGDKYHAELVYKPAIRKAVDMARGANYCAMLHQRSRREDLYLFSMNTSELYEQRAAIERSAQSRLENGDDLDRIQSMTLRRFRHWLNSAAHRYAKEFPDTPYPYFTDADKDAVAERIAAETIEEAKLGGFL